MGEKIKNYETVNCYIDTSYLSRDNKVIVSNFSSEDGNIQERDITNKLKVKAKDGFSFKDASKQSFDLKIKDEWYTITYDLFKELDEEIDFQSIIDADKEKSHPFYWDYANVDASKTLIYQVTDDIMLVLLGGFSDSFLYVVGFMKNTSRYDFIYKDEMFTQVDVFGKDVYNDSVFAGFELRIENLKFIAETATQEPIEDTTQYLFKTYYIESGELSSIPNKTDVYNEAIINTYTYPLIIKDDYLVDVDITIAGVSQNLKAKRFLKNVIPIEIFKFNVGDYGNVEQCYLNIPFNDDVRLNYEDIQGKSVIGTLYYEVLTNTTTLIISDGVKTLYKDIVSLGVKVPYKPTGEVANFSEPNTRLVLNEPKMYIKTRQLTEKTNFLKGYVKLGFSDILKEELEILNNLIEKGVYINEQ